MRIIDPLNQHYLNTSMHAYTNCCSPFCLMSPSFSFACSDNEEPGGQVRSAEGGAGSIEKADRRFGFHCRCCRGTVLPHLSKHKTCELHVVPLSQFAAQDDNSDEKKYDILMKRDQDMTAFIDKFDEVRLKTEAVKGRVSSSTILGCGWLG